MPLTDEHSVTTPLLSDQAGYGEKKFQLKLLAKWVLKVLMWLIFIAWVAVIFLYPAEFYKQVSEKWNEATGKTIFGHTGSYFLLFSGPVLIIAVLAIFHLMISGEEKFHEKKSSKRPSFRLWTFPVLIDGPFGVVSATEFIGILLCVVYVIWAMYSYTSQSLHLLSVFQKMFPMSSREKSLLLEKLTGLRLGMVGLFCMAFLFLPVSRGSVLLRLIDIPFEHATRYHVWLGHITMVLFTLHGLFYMHAWQVEGRLIEEVLEWRNIGFANLAGVISLLAGVLMWVTSLPRVRKINFELFFYTHQLYVVFVVFLAMHVGDFIFSMAAGGIFLFILDRFLRFCQSRRTVNVISARSLPCGTMELVFSKPRNLRYNALSFIFVQVRELSWLQWHPFSVSSSPLDGNHHLAVLIKVLGKWTDKLNHKILSLSEAEPQKVLTSNPQASIVASVEGPYGHELPYHLMYENLILVAGGIGVSPFLAIMSDILHRKREGRPCLPKNVLLIWAIKKSDELPILSTVDLESICPSHSNKLNLDIRIYITRELEPPLEEGKDMGIGPSFCPPSSGCPMSVLVGTGDNIWSGMYVISSIVGFIVLMSLLQKFYINANGIDSWWYKGLLFVLMMVASVIVFGGLVVVLWHLWERKMSGMEKVEPEKNGKVHLCEPIEDDNLSQKGIASLTTLQYGTRPDFKAIFGNICESWGNVDVGVIVCGPETLQASVARECRSRTMWRQHQHPIFHFNSHSFDL